MPEESPLLLPSAEELPTLDAVPVAPEPGPAEPSPEPPFICECGEWKRSACVGQYFYKEHGGQRYCVLHYPGKEKASEFESAFRKKLETQDYNFRGVWFPDTFALLNGFQFKADADFGSAIFNADASFHHTIFGSSAIFSRAQFSKSAYFGNAEFGGEVNFRFALFNSRVYLSQATFSAAVNFEAAIFNTSVDFRDTKFYKGAKFNFAVFNADANFSHTIFDADAYFHRTKFNADVDFSNASFKDEVHFSGSDNFNDQSSLNLQFSRIEKPERVSFHTTTLRPFWFVNVDPRKFVFTDVSWNFDTSYMGEEIQCLIEKQVSSPHQLLIITCRQLAENAETNNRYEEASHFRYWAMRLVRIHKWTGLAFSKTNRLYRFYCRVSGYGERISLSWLHLLYWAMSGYSERLLRAFAWLLAVWVVFALLYMRVGFTQPADKSAPPTNPITAIEPDIIGQPLPFKRALTYSLGVMSLQKPEPKPLTGTAQTLVLLETILGPLQAALLALAIRRKFMR